MEVKRARKNLVEAIKKYILEDENKEEIVAELKRYRKEFHSEPDYNWYRYGNILPYYSQIRSFYEENGMRANEDDEILCRDFCYNVGKAIDSILEEDKL